MERVLEAIAQRLTVRSTVSREVSSFMKDVLKVQIEMFERRPATIEEKEAFKEQLVSHIKTKLEEASIGDCIDYSFDERNIHPIDKLMTTAGNNMSAVLYNLRKACPLKEGEGYDLPLDTYFGIVLTEKNEEGMDIKLYVCPWIKEAYI